MKKTRFLKMVWTLPPLREDSGVTNHTGSYPVQTVIGLDIAKRVFQLHSVDPSTGAIVMTH